MTVTTLQLTLLVAVTTTGCAAVVLGLLTRRGSEAWAKRALVAAFAAVSLPLAVLVGSFLTTTLDAHYVWAHTKASYPWWLKLAGVWGGQEGTFLLWSWLVLGALLLEQHRADEPTWPEARALGALVALLLVVPALTLGLGTATIDLGLTPQGTFEVGAAGPNPLDLRPEGQGLNPLLESPYMAIHPLVQFIAYAAITVVAVYALVHLARGGAWRTGGLRWARAAWLTLVAALALGALWAYVVLSFGGYWAWDPVETADLLPLVALTVLLHAAPIQRRTGQLGLLAPAAGAAALVLVFFATFVTRTGLWASVHAFLPTGIAFTINDPGARLVAILDESAPARHATRLFALALSAMSTAGALALGRHLDAGARPLAARAAWAGAAAFAFIGLSAVLAPGPVAGGLHRFAQIVGAGNTLAGVAVLVLLALTPYLIALARNPPGQRLDVRERNGQLVLAAYLLVVLLMATTLLLVLGVNGYDASVFTARLPWLAAPVLALQAVTFHVVRWHRRVQVLVVAVGLALVLLALTRSFAWAAVPLALAALAGPFAMLVQRAAPAGSRRDRTGAALVLVAGLTGLAQWASPGTLALAGVGLSSPGWYVPLGIGFALAALVLSFVPRAPRWAAPVAGVLAVGYGFGALAALAGLALTRGHRPAPLRKLAVPIVHIGLVLLVLGVALSTYAQTAWTLHEDAPLERGVPRTLGPWTVELVGGSVADTNEDGRVDRVTAVLHVWRGGAFLGETTAALDHSFNAGFTARGAFVPQDTPLVRTATGDLVLDADPARPLAVRVRGDNTTWVVANSAPPTGLAGEVDAVATGVVANPGINLVWAGVPLLLLGAGLRLGLNVAPARAARPRT